MSVRDAIGLVDLAIKATTAYQRPDLTARLKKTRERLSDPNVRVLVVGEFKQGKSQLVNALVSADICPVDDDIATAVPTVVRYAENPTAIVVRERSDGSAPAERRPVPITRLAQYVSEEGNPGNSQHFTYAEVGLPRKLLSEGLVLVDTPGVGGLGSAHGAATMASLSTADAVLLVSDAAQEYTKAELDFLSAARQLCPNVAAVLTKTDLYPHWQRIAELNRNHLRAVGIEADLLPVSSTLRMQALRTKDKELNEESGYAALIRYLREQVLRRSDELDRRTASQEVLSVCEQLTTTMQTELAAQENPEQVAELVAELERIKERAEALKDRSARWQITLNDGIADLTADIEHDLRDRLRRILRDAEDLVDDNDPAEVWDQLAQWIYREVSAATSANFLWASRRAHWLASQVADHFAVDGQTALPQIDILGGKGMQAPRVAAMERPETPKLSLGERALSGLRGGYMGGLMFFMPLTLIPGLAVAAPFAAAGGALILARKQLKDEQERALQRRRAEAKAVIRKHIDEVQFQVGKDSRDRLRQTQRTLRDHFSQVAEELHTSMTESLAAAQAAVRSTEAERNKRIADLKAELARVEGLAARARALVAGT